MMPTARTWFLSDGFYPETEGTGFYMTGIAESLAREPDNEVFAVCAQPGYSRAGLRAPRNETYANIHIHRCFSTCWDRHRILGRIVNLLTFSVSALIYLLFALRKSDRLFVGTSPPNMPIVAYLACVLKRAELIIYVHDVFPDIAVVAGVVRRHGIIERLWRSMNRIVYGSARQVIAVGRDMKRHLVDSYGIDPDRVFFIPEFVDCHSISPCPREDNRILAETSLLDRVVVLLAGNLGPVHDVETFLEATRLLHDVPEVIFLVIGSGKNYLWLQDVVAEESIDNILILPRMPRNESCTIMNACDIAIAGLFVPGMLGLACPSRTFDCLAAGKPIVVLADKESEPALIVVEGELGWWVAPKDAQGLANSVREALAQKGSLLGMGTRARETAITTYSRDSVLPKMARTITGLGAWSKTS